MSKSTPKKTLRAGKQSKKYGNSQPTTPTKRNYYEDFMSFEEEIDDMVVDMRKMKPSDKAQESPKTTLRRSSRVRKYSRASTPSERNSNKEVLSSEEDTYDDIISNGECKAKLIGSANSTPRKSSRVRKNSLASTSSRRKSYKEVLSSEGDTDNEFVAHGVRKAKSKGNVQEAIHTPRSSSRVRKGSTATTPTKRNSYKDGFSSAEDTDNEESKIKGTGKLQISKSSSRRSSRAGRRSKSATPSRRDSFKGASSPKGGMDDEVNKIKPTDKIEETAASTSTRKTSRVRKQPKKFGDFLPTSPAKRNTYKDISDEEMDDDVGDEANKLKPSGSANSTPRKSSRVRKNSLASTSSRRKSYKEVLSSEGDTDNEFVAHGVRKAKSKGNVQEAIHTPRSSSRVRKGSTATTPTKRNSYKDGFSSAEDTDNEESKIKGTGKLQISKSSSRRSSRAGRRSKSATPSRRDSFKGASSPKGGMDDEVNKIKPTDQIEETAASTSTRKTSRVRKQPKKFGDFLPTSPTKRNTYKDISDEEMDDDVGDEANKLKPSALFSSDDVQGQDIFQCQSRHTVLNLQKVAQSFRNVTLTPQTPSKTAASKVMQQSKVAEQTPKHVHNMIKKRIYKEVESESSDGDYSRGSSTDFVPDDSDDESQSSHSADSDTGDEEFSNKVHEKAEIVKRKTKQSTKDQEYYIAPDNYFMMNSGKKIQTSDHTLARLGNLDLNENEDQTIHISEEHKDKIAKLNASYRHLFHKWMFILVENFSVLLYGIGSKRSILHQFQMELLKDFPCIVVNGFFPSLTIKSVLEAIVIDLLENTTVPTNIGDTVKLIESQLSDNDAELFLIVNNIDGPMLRNDKAQTTLASLAQIRNVHLIASIDHINAPLLWDQKKLCKLRWSWWNVTTFQPYSAESAPAGTLRRRGGALQLASLRTVHRALTANGRGVYHLLVRHQLDNHKQPHYQGMPLKVLYSKSREQFLVSSDVALRAQLTELMDHKLVKIKRTCDGSENLIIPIDTALLQQFLEQNEV